jgi:hypothetical protein
MEHAGFAGALAFPTIGGAFEFLDDWALGAIIAVTPLREIGDRISHGSKICDSAVEIGEMSEGQTPNIFTCPIAVSIKRQQFAHIL